MIRLIKPVIRNLIPPALWKLLGGLKRVFRHKTELNKPASTDPPTRIEAVQAPKLRAITTLEELDQFLVVCDNAGQVSDDALRETIRSFYFNMPINLPPDPLSSEYSAAQMSLYEMIAGRGQYQVMRDEMTEFDLRTQLRQPFPYCTQSPTTIGEQLMAIGFLLRSSRIQANERLLEFGAGWGTTTVHLVQMGCQVTAVDVNSRFLQLIEQRCQQIERPVQTYQCDMLEFETTEKFDTILFYESFHHCRDHIGLIRRLPKMLAPGGKVIFAGEPIADGLSYPWGVRLDGQSVWSIRKFGWLELGFRTDYFQELLQAHGWQLQIDTSKDVPWMMVVTAQHESTLGGTK